jgi:hypothetical protein
MTLQRDIVTGMLLRVNVGGVYKLAKECCCKDAAGCCGYTVPTTLSTTLSGVDITSCVKPVEGTYDITWYTSIYAPCAWRGGLTAVFPPSPDIGDKVYSAEFVLARLYQGEWCKSEAIWWMELTVTIFTWDGNAWTGGELPSAIWYWSKATTIPTDYAGTYTFLPAFSSGCLPMGGTLTVT